MTAEVAILSKRGIALAADSAVTIRSGDQSKVFNSANKLLMLAEDQPVGVMVYGNADFVGIPWETLLKEFRRGHGSETHSHLSDYAASLIGFIAERVPALASDEERSTDSLGPVVQRLLFLRGEIQKRIVRHAERDGSTKARSLKILAALEVSEFAEAHESYEYLEGFDESDTRRILRGRADELDHMIGRLFDTDLLSVASMRKLRKIISDLLFRAWGNPSFSGLVIAGFGTDQVFPSLRHFHMYGHFADRLRYALASSVEIDSDNRAYVLGFAQGDMIHTFMEGVDPAFLQYHSAFLERAFASLPDAVVAGVNLPARAKRAVQRNASEAAEGMATSIQDGLNAYRRKEHVDPVLDTISMMPIDEMAALAQALVNLTSLKRRTQMVAESVGGPVDVAVISKGDGFVWIDRKHYFRPELNPRFLARYARTEQQRSTDE